MRIIERSMWWRGWARRKDITDLFGVSTAQASGDFQKYLEMNPGVLAYNTSRKRYETIPASAWVIAEPSFEEAVSVFLGEDRFSYPRQVGEGERVACVGLTARQGPPLVLRHLMLAILGGKELEIEYFSLPGGKAGWRKIEPHSLGHDGYRWHARAYCHESGDYRDFVLSRISDSKWPSREAGQGGLGGDKAWGTREKIELKPHRSLSKAERRAVELDYGIKAGGSLRLEVRTAMKEYLLAYLRVDQIDLPKLFETVG